MQATCHPIQGCQKNEPQNEAKVTSDDLKNHGKAGLSSRHLKTNKRAVPLLAAARLFFMSI